MISGRRSMFSPRMGRRIVTTGGVERSETRGDPNNDSAPDGAAETTPLLAYSQFTAMPPAEFTSPSPLAGRGRILEEFHGLRGGGYAAAPLHPWLHSVAPFGAKDELLVGE